jgi:hypothetical protein
MSDFKIIEDPVELMNMSERAYKNYTAQLDRYTRIKLAAEEKAKALAAAAQDKPAA